MAIPEAIKNEIVGKTKRLVGEVLGDQKLHDEGNAQELVGREQRSEPANIKPFGDLDDLT